MMMICLLFFQGLEEDARTDREEETKADFSASDSEHSEEDEDKEVFDEDLQPLETPYTVNINEELGQVDFALIPHLLLTIRVPCCLNCIHVIWAEGLLI